MRASVFVKKSSAKNLNRGGCWVYDNEIERIDGEYDNGDIVKVKDDKDRVLGLGFINSNSKIRVRILTRDKKQEINRDFFRDRLSACIEFRKKVSDMNCCRLVFGEADFLPGLTIDKYNDVLVVQSLALGIDKYKEIIVEELINLLTADGFPIRGAYERSDANVRNQEGLSPVKGFIGSEFDVSDIYIEENGIKYQVDIVDGQKTGFFLDQKNNRAAVQKIAKDLCVLECFTHTGSFALNALKGGAAHVTAVDISDKAIEMAKHNAELNHMSDKISFVCADVFEVLPQWVAEKKFFDFVILDPPAFAKSRGTVSSASRGYKEINFRGLRLVRDGGFFATCSCSHFMNKDLFTSVIEEAALDAGVLLREIEYRSQSPDHPVIWGSNDSYYLKFIIFQVFKK